MRKKAYIKYKNCLLRVYYLFMLILSLAAGPRVPKNRTCDTTRCCDGGACCFGCVGIERRLLITPFCLFGNSLVQEGTRCIVQQVMHPPVS